MLPATASFVAASYEEVDPLDDWLDTSPTYDEDALLWVDTVDPNVIAVEWFVDDVSLGMLGESLDVGSLSLSAGFHTVTALAYDEILDHAFTGDSLDWWRLPDVSLLQQSIMWSLLVTIPEPVGGGVCLMAIGVFVGRRRKTRPFRRP